MTITLLITGVGGPLGQALIKAARLSALPARIAGSDRHALSIGLDWVDHSHLIASSSKPETYLSDIKRICRDEQITLILPGSDSELELLSSAAESLHVETGATVVCSPPDVLRIALDKWATCEFLRTSGRAFPACARLSDREQLERLIERFGFPLIAKPARGSGSRGVVKIRDRRDLDYHSTLETDIIVQEYLRPDDEEYTIAVYTQRDGTQAGGICFKRELVAGNTYRAWVDQNPVVIAEAKAVVRSLGAVGPCNVQLRLTERGPVTFEINPRFSGTTAMRAHFGYNEVEMAMRDFALKAEVPKPVVRPGVALRFWDEVYLDGDQRPIRASQTKRRQAFRVLRTSDVAEWTGVLQRTVQHDIYFLPSYHAVSEQRGEGEARLFVYEEGEHLIALPLMLRRVGDIPELNGSDGEWRDATSVYGYVGPLASDRHVPAGVVKGFHEALTASLRESKIVAVFSRLHPLIDQRPLLDGIGLCRAGGETVSVDLTLPPAEQRAGFRGTVKNRINRLLRIGASCERDADKRHLSEFISIYHETMRRVHADSIYFFDRDYFERLAANLGPALQLWLVRQAKGEIMSGGLFTICDGVVQYHLGGTRDEALNASPTTLIFDCVRVWANEQHARIFHLGGGVGSKADSLFQFKTRFSDRRHEFATWRWIIAPEAYGELSQQKHDWNSQRGLKAISPSFFPAYRCPAEPDPMFAAVSGSASNSVAANELLPVENG